MSDPRHSRPEGAPDRRGGAAALTVLLIALAATACRESWEERTIRSYNDAAIVAYRTGDMSGLETVATADEVRKVTALVDLKRAEKLVLESSLDRLEVLKSESVGPDGAVVETRERWTYQDRPLTPGAPPGTRFVSEMTMRYECTRVGGEWKIEKVRTLTNEFLEPKGFRAEGHGKQHGGTGPEGGAKESH